MVVGAERREKKLLPRSHTAQGGDLAAEGWEKTYLQDIVLKP